MDCPIFTGYFSVEGSGRRGHLPRDGAEGQDKQVPERAGKAVPPSLESD